MVGLPDGVAPMTNCCCAGSPRSTSYTAGRCTRSDARFLDRLCLRPDAKSRDWGGKLSNAAAASAHSRRRIRFSAWWRTWSGEWVIDRVIGQADSSHSSFRRGTSDKRLTPCERGRVTERIGMSRITKVCTFDELLSRREAARRDGRAVVHCHGCFDIVHPGHIQHLQFARSLGDVLVVSVSADRHVNKGAARPLIPDDLRAASVAALECVDYVYVNPDPTAVELLAALKPDVYVKGSEYERSADHRFLAERDTVIRHGG